MLAALQRKLDRQQGTIPAIKKPAIACRFFYSSALAGEAYTTP